MKNPKEVDFLYLHNPICNSNESLKKCMQANEVRRSSLQTLTLTKHREIEG